MHVASKEDNNNYKFTVSIKTCDGVQSVTSCLKCPNYLDFIDKELHREKCAEFSKEFTKQCVNKEDKLPLEFEIS